MEKEQRNFLASRKGEKNFEEMYETCLTCDLNLKKERTNFCELYQKILKLIDKFKIEAKHRNQNESFIEKLKNLMEQIDSLITDSKENMLLKLEEFTSEEKLLSKEIELYDKKIQNWLLNKNDGQSATNIKKTSLINDKLESSDLLKEVVDFDKFLINNGGHNGGWEEIDHSLFIRIRTKHKGKASFKDELEKMIATKNRDEIEKHEEWYQTYNNLSELKKEAIKKWKEQKNASKNEVVNLVDEELKLNEEIEKELKNRFEKKRLQEKADRNKKLNQWKIEKEIQKAKEIEKRKKEEELQTEKEIKKRQEQDELRMKVAEYKKQKEELNEYIELEQYLLREIEQENKIKNTKKEITRFQSRDLAQLREKKARQNEKKIEAERRQKVLESTKEKVDVDYDPNRLYRMTNSWKSRVNTPRSDSAGPVATPRMPHLAIPSWRKGI